MADVIDEMYPNDGEFFEAIPVEPAQQVAEREKERSKTRNAMPLIKDLIVRMQNRIDYYDSIKAIPLADRKDDSKFRTAVIANEQTKVNLEMELSYLKQLADEYGQ